MKCNKCGNELPDGSIFCNICGNKLEELSQTQSTKSMGQNENIQTQNVHRANVNNSTHENKNGVNGVTITLSAGIIILLILATGTFSILPIFVKSEAIQVPYQEAIQQQVPIKYTHSGSWIGTMATLLNWEIESTVSVTNTDTEPGSFTAYIIVKDGDRTAYTSSSQTKYIYPGNTAQFTFMTDGLSYSTDYNKRYSVTHYVTPSKKTITTYITNYRTEYQNKNVNLLQYLSGT